MKKQRNFICGLAAICLATLAAQETSPAQEATRGVHLSGPKSPDNAPHGAAVEGESRELPAIPQLNNPAQVSLTISPGSNTHIGDKLSFRVSAKKKGSFILVDVDAEGRVTQIFPNFLSLASEQGQVAESNKLVVNAPVLVPAEGSKLYEFVASPPGGVGMTLAIFSEAPIEMVDLPDVPAEMVGRAEAAEFLCKAADGLQIVSADPAAGFQPAKFSYAAQFYRVR
jgi:hypothetical protein